jgi:hypothetical protein
MEVDDEEAEEEELEESCEEVNEDGAAATDDDDEVADDDAAPLTEDEEDCSLAWAIACASSDASSNLRNTMTRVQHPALLSVTSSAKVS